MNKAKSSGFTYLGLIFIFTILSITAALAGSLWSFAQKREKERQLLFVGHQFRRAIGNYYEKTPGVIKRYPANLQELLQDNRYVSTQRYLRRIYLDPMTGSAEWGTISAPTGGIMGVYSKSEEKPVKTGNFSLKDIFFEQQANYSDWKFIYAPVIILQNNSNNPSLN